MNEPYDPNMPDMPPLIDDVILPSKTNPEAEELAKAAKEIGFKGIIAAALPPKGGGRRA